MVEKYFEFALWRDFYIPLIIIGFSIGLFIASFLLIKVSQLKKKISNLPFFRKRRAAKKIKFLTDCGYEEIMLDDCKAYVPHDVAYSEEDYVDPYSKHIFLTTSLAEDKYSWKEITNKERNWVYENLR